MGWKLSEDHIRMAQETEKKYGVPASVTLGQFITESGAGTSGLFKISNNGFGIIGSYNGQKVWYNDRYWRKYPSLQASFDDHGRLLASGQYAEATKNAKTVDQYIDAILPIYAPESDGNSGYPALLRAVIRDNNLTQYDGAWAGKAGSFGTDRPNSSGSSGFSGSSGSFESGAQTSGGGSKISGILATVIKIGAFLFLFTLAVIFFAQAFEIEAPKKQIKKVVSKE